MKNLVILLACAIVVVGIASYITKDKDAMSVSGVSTDLSDAQPSSENAQSAASSTSSSSTSALSNQQANKKIMNTNSISQATFHTNKGDITLELFASKAPNTVSNFVKLASEGFYDGVKFHRVIKGFMIQGGDPLTKDDSAADRWGTGGPGYTFNDELGAEYPANKNDVGTIAMANAGPNTNGSQFFINVNPNNFLDGKHVVFGKVTSGMDVVTAIENVKTDGNDRPVSPVIINSVTLK